jgi:methylated-DNA-[protein]-cysteine S-methyltransferase
MRLHASNEKDLVTGNALFRSIFETPYGSMQTAVDADGVLVEVWLPNRGPKVESAAAFSKTALEATQSAQEQLREYFNGARRTFELLIEPRGSPFERIVWERLRAIPYGQTTSYGAIASELGHVNGARAVGRANGSNPIPIIIPCHRVIGTNGRLTGYGGGLPLKQALLELEGALLPAPRFL